MPSVPQALARRIFILTSQVLCSIFRPPDDVWILFGDRLMVGLRILIPPIKVQILVPELRPHGLAVRTLASHAEIPGSIPGGVTQKLMHLA